MRAIYIPFPGSRRFVVLVGGSVNADLHDTVLSESIGHHLLDHDGAVVRAWAPESDCPFGRDDALWGIAFLHPRWTNGEILAAYRERAEPPHADRVPRVNRWG